MNAVSPVLVADDEATNTPGFFFHGSPRANIDQFKSQAEQGEGRAGIYLTQVAGYAAAYAADVMVGVGKGGGRGRGGRVYAVELVTRNPLELPAGFWTGKKERCAELEIEVEQQALAKGHDCVVSAESEGLITEMVVLDPAVIRYRSPMGPVAKVARDALTSGMFYCIEDEDGPEYAPGAAYLFSSQARAAAFDGDHEAFAVGLCERRSVYCDREMWPLMECEFLSENGVDVLVDPTSGDALVLSFEAMVPLNNRTRKRIYRSRRR